MPDIAQGKLVPPPPHKSKVLDATGMFSPFWATWFSKVYLRIGESAALTNIELNESASTIEADLQATITALAALTARVEGLEGLGQGRQL